MQKDHQIKMTQLEESHACSANHPSCFFSTAGAAICEPSILIVDSYPPGQRLLSELCTYAGLNAKIIPSTLALQDILKDKNIACILIDTDAYGGSWLDHIQKMRISRSTNASVPVITFSASLQAHEKEQWENLGVTATLTKPICVSHFFQILERWVAPRLDRMHMDWLVRWPQTFPMSQSAQKRTIPSRLARFPI